jgi:hypothetical protein
MAVHDRAGLVENRNRPLHPEARSHPTLETLDSRLRGMTDI